MIWKRKSEEFCEYRCFVTGIKYNYEVHHIRAFNEIVKEALNELNIKPSNLDKLDGEALLKLREVVILLHDKYGLGICLNKNIHILFHSQYGKISNKRDFIKFIRNYYNGEYNHLLDSEFQSEKSIERLGKERVDEILSFF